MFRLGLVRPHYFTPGRGTTTTLAAACPYIPTPLLRGHRSFVPSFLSLSLSFSVSVSPVPSSSPPASRPCFSILSPYNAVQARRSLCLTFTPCASLLPFSPSLCRSRNDTIGLSLSSRGRKLSPHTYARVYTHLWWYKRYLSIWASVYR